MDLMRFIRKFSYIPFCSFLTVFFSFIEIIYAAMWPLLEDDGNVDGDAASEKQKCRQHEKSII